MVEEGMRGDDQQKNHLFSYLSPEARVHKDYPLRGHPGNDASPIKNSTPACVVQEDEPNSQVTDSNVVELRTRIQRTVATVEDRNFSNSRRVRAQKYRLCRM